MNNTLPVCPFGATCYRKNLLHFAQYSHPFDLLNPDVDSSDEEEEVNKKTQQNDKTDDGKKRKLEVEEEDDGDKTEEYDTDDVSCRWVISGSINRMFDIGKCIRCTIEKNFFTNDRR